MIKEYVQDLPGGKELLMEYFFFGFGIVSFIWTLSLFLFSNTIIYEINTIIEQDLNIPQQISSLNNLKNVLDYLSWLFLIGTLFFGLKLFYDYYTWNRSDKIFRKAVEKGFTPLPIDKPYISNAKVNPDQLKAQKARTIDFLSKLDERFINKELSDINYKELKAKYENQLKDIEKQIVDAELHE